MYKIMYIVQIYYNLIKIKIKVILAKGKCKAALETWHNPVSG